MQNSKFEYVPQSDNSYIVEIKLEDISFEIYYWSNSLVCYVIGDHPHFIVLQGFMQRLWSKYGRNKILVLRNDILLV